MQQITSEGRMIRQVSAGMNSVLCIGMSTGLTIMDEQRIALEEKITQLAKEMEEDQPVKEKKSRRKTSKKGKAKDDFRDALFENKSDNSKFNSTANMKKSHSSILKSTSSQIHKKIQKQ